MSVVIAAQTIRHSYKKHRCKVCTMPSQHKTCACGKQLRRCTICNGGGSYFCMHSRSPHRCKHCAFRQMQRNAAAAAMTEFLREFDHQFPEECQTSSMEEFSEWFSSCCQQRPESAHVKALKATKPVRAMKAQKEGYEGEQKRFDDG